MAVTPVGNPYVESSDLVANYPGVSEALAERIDIVGVNPFADSAARATAIPSPVEGQMASLNDDDKVYRYSGSAWVAVGLPPGLNPVAPTSIANSGGSASTTENTTTFTTVTAISLNGIFTSAYSNYRIIVGATSAVGAELRIRLRVGGTDNSASSYDIFAGYAGTLNGNDAANGTLWIMATSSAISQKIGFDIYAPFVAGQTQALFQHGNTNNAGTGYTISGILNHRTSTSFDGLTVLFSQASSGTIQVFGYKN